jgi:hypothetical protein
MRRLHPPASYWRAENALLVPPWFHHSRLLALAWKKILSSYRLRAESFLVAPGVNFCCSRSINNSYSYSGGTGDNCTEALGPTSWRSITTCC